MPWSPSSLKRRTRRTSVRLGRLRSPVMGSKLIFNKLCLPLAFVWSDNESGEKSVQQAPVDPVPPAVNPKPGTASQTGASPPLAVKPVCPGSSTQLFGTSLFAAAPRAFWPNRQMLSAAHAATVIRLFTSVRRQFSFNS